MRSLLYLLLFLLISQVSWGQRFADILKQYRQTDTRYTPVTAYFKDGALQIRGLKGKFKIKHPNEGYVDDFFWYGLICFIVVVCVLVFLEWGSLYDFWCVAYLSLKYYFEVL